MSGDDPRRVAPAAERNRDAILDVLTTVLPGTGTVLEVASGTGQHIVHFARHVRHLRWQPSEIGAEGRASIEAYAADERLPNLVLPPLALDATAAAWPELGVNAIVCINMIHIAPWAACEGLFRRAAAALRAGASLTLYGPFLQDGVETAASNLAFDRSLRSRDPAWGVRRLEDVTDVARRNGFRRGKTVAMPANNLTAVFFRD